MHQQNRTNFTYLNTSLVTELFIYDQVEQQSLLSLPVQNKLTKLEKKVHVDELKTDKCVIATLQQKRTIQLIHFKINQSNKFLI